MSGQNFNVWDSFTQGMGLMDNFARMRDDARQRQHMVAQDRAMQELAEQPYIPGYEGVQGAEMVPWLRDLIKVNPEMGLKFGNQVAMPFAAQRDVQKAVDIDKGKKDARLDMVLKMMTALGMKGAPGGGSNIFQAGYQPPFPGGELSPWAPPDAQAPQGLEGLSGVSSRIKLDENGPEVSFDRMSPLEEAAKRGHLQVEQGNLKVNEGNLGLAKERRGEERLKATSDSTRQQVQNEQDAYKTVSDLHSQMYAISSNDNISPQQKEVELSQLRPLYKQAQQRLHDVTKGLGRLSTNPEDYGNTRQDSADPMLKSALSGTGSQQGQPMQEAPVRPSSPKPTQGGQQPPSGNGLSYRRDQENKQKLAEQEASSVLKDIEAARHNKAKIGNYRDAMGQIHDLVSQNELGHPTTVGIGGDVAKSLHKINPMNAQLDNLSNQVGNSLIKEGQSQLMNTIIERMMVTSPVPSLATDPHQNRINSVNQMNGLHGVDQLPDAMQRYADKHGNLRGFESAWMDYYDNNKPYTYEKNAQGKVTVKPKREDVLSATDWFALRDKGYSTSSILTIRSKGNKMRVMKSGPEAGTLLTQEKDGSWVAH